MAKVVSATAGLALDFKLSCMVCRWPCLTGLRELDFGENHRISGPALQALSALSCLSRLACLVNGSLPSSVSSLAQLQALEIRWFSDADGGATSAAWQHAVWSPEGCRRCVQGRSLSCHLGLQQHMQVPADTRPSKAYPYAQH